MTGKNVKESVQPLAPARPRFKAYPAYKDSGVEWLGEIPAGWEALSLKRVAAIRYGLGEPPQLLAAGLPFVRATNVEKGRIVDRGMQFVDPKDVPWSRDPSLRTGDIIVVRSGAYTGDSAIVTESYHGAIAGYDMVVRVRRSRAGFLAWALLSRYVLEAQIEIESMRAAQPHLNAEELGTVAILLPPEPEQRTIAAFLDRETARIDALVAKKERLIALLQEQRTALIEAAVDTARASPETRLGYYVDLLPGYAFSSGEFSHDPEDIRLLRGVNISPGSIRWDDTVLWPLSGSARYATYQLREGDLVFGMDRPWISTGIRVAEVTRADVPSLLLQRVARLRARRGLSQRFLKLVLGSPQFRAYFEPILTGISVPHVSPEQILSFRLRLPTLEDQEAVCQSVRVQCLHIGSMSDVFRKSIDRLKELRTALISAAVTGKIDVREEVA